MTRAQPCAHVSEASGFSLVELVTVIAIAGVLAAVAIPRLVSQSSLDSRGVRDQSVSALRYAQKLAVASRREVCVTYVAGPPAGFSLTLNPTTTAGAACSQNVLQPGSTAPYQVTLPANGNVGLAAFAAFRFNTLGQPVPNAAQTLTLTNVPVITVTQETGYVQ